MPYPQISSDQRQAIARSVEAVIQQAARDADLVGQFLLSHGYQPTGGRGDAPNQAAQPSPAMNGASMLLLNLAAALRIARWERQSIKSRLPETLPDSTVALKATLAATNAAPDDRAAPRPALHQQVFTIWLKHFSRQGSQQLGTDVLMNPADVNPDALLDTLADLLWQHRHLTNTSEDIT